MRKLRPVIHRRKLNPPLGVVDARICPARHRRRAQKAHMRFALRRVRAPRSSRKCQSFARGGRPNGCVRSCARSRAAGGSAKIVKLLRLTVPLAAADLSLPTRVAFRCAWIASTSCAIPRVRASDRTAAVPRRVAPWETRANPVDDGGMIVSSVGKRFSCSVHISETLSACPTVSTRNCAARHLISQSGSYSGLGVLIGVRPKRRSS